jgi:hypothetical protein
MTCPITLLIVRLPCVTADQEHVDAISQLANFGLSPRIRLGLMPFRRPTLFLGLAGQPGRLLPDLCLGFRPTHFLLAFSLGLGLFPLHHPCLVLRLLPRPRVGLLSCGFRCFPPCPFHDLGPTPVLDLSPLLNDGLLPRFGSRFFPILGIKPRFLH